MNCAKEPPLIENQDRKNTILSGFTYKLNRNQFNVYR